MAVLALGFVGEAIGASIGGTLLGVTAASIGGLIGSAVGGLIDNLLFPVNQQGPRLSDLTVQTSTYGSAIPFAVGPENRLAGNVIWSTGLIETAHHQHSGPFGKGGPSVNTTTYTYSASFAVVFSDTSKTGPAKAVDKIWANKKLVYDATGSTSPDNAGLWSSMTFYDGNPSQMPDPVMEAHKGVGNVPAYRRRSMLVFDVFQLADYGNRLPSIEVLLRADDATSVGAVVHLLTEIAGIDPNTVSVSTLTQIPLRGFTVGTQSSVTSAIQPLALVGNFDPAQVGGGLRFKRRGYAPRASFPKEYFGGHVPGDDAPDALQWTHAPETGLPREASISFPDPAMDYQVNSQTARRQSGDVQNNLSSQLPVTVDATTARQLADRMLWEAWTQRSKANAQSDDRLVNAEAGSSYCVETPAGYEAVRLKTRTRGENGIIEFEFARDQDAVYRSASVGVAAQGVPVQRVNVPGPSTVVMIDGPILQDTDDDTGFYFLVDGTSADFRGADVIRSTDEGATYDEVEAVGFESVLGTISGMTDGPTDIFDETTVVRVTLDDIDDDLESMTELDVLNGKNACWIGPTSGQDGEIAQFKTATLVSAGVYDLSGWLRGRLGTEFATGTHAAGHRFVLLSVGPVRRADFNQGDWNKTRTYKAVSLLTLEADATPVDFANSGEGKRPLSPVHVTSATVAGDMVISWLRRSRYHQPGLGGGPLALGETTEAYEIDVYHGLTFKRTLTATSETVTYVAADLATDGFVSGDSVTVQVFQMSDVRGRGRPGRGVLVL
jgi:hypothetical protein